MCLICAHNLYFPDAINAREGFSCKLYMTGSLLKRTVTHHTTTFLWLLKGLALERKFEVLLVWNRKREVKELVSVKKNNNNFYKVRAAPAMQSRNMTDDISNPLCSSLQSSLEITKRIAHDYFSSLCLCRKHMQAKEQTFSAWPICKISYIFPGQMSQVTLRCTRDGIKSVGLMEPVRRFQSGAVNTAGL